MSHEKRVSYFLTRTKKAITCYVRPSITTVCML